MSIKTKTLRRYLKNLSQKLKHIKETKFQEGVFKSVNIYFQDESRFGLLTIQRRILTVRGVKPLQPYQHKFKNLYLFGAFSPVTGTHFTLELPKCNADCFQLYLDEFSRHDPGEFKIIVLDNGAFHKAAQLGVPQNIALLFIPPYSPELNPAEKMWRLLKDSIATVVFPTLEHLSDRLCEAIKALSQTVIKSITGYRLYLDNFNAVF
jgi:transposase